MRGLSRKPGDLLVAVAQSSSRGVLRERTNRVATRTAWQDVVTGRACKS